MPHPYQNLESHPLWPVIEEAIGELIENSDLSLTTAEALVIGYLVSKAVGNNSVVVDWRKCRSADAFYDSVFAQCEATTGHGRNLNALSDAWVAGGINAVDPPYSFWFLNGLSADPALAEFRCAVEEIASESVAAHGGQIHRTELGKRISEPEPAPYSPTGDD